MRIIALDPGETVGWATYIDGRYSSGQVPSRELWALLQVFSTEAKKKSVPGKNHFRIHLVKHGIYIVYESFQGRPQAADLISVECIGVIKEWRRQNPVFDFSFSTTHTNIGEGLFSQKSSDAKFYFTDDKLEEAGVLIKPKTKNRHANDAYRHLLFFITFGKGKDLVKNG